MQHPWLWFWGSVGLLAAWYTTPISDFVTELVLHEVPIEADLELEWQAPRKLVRSSYDYHWSPIISRIGRELLHTLQRSDFSFSSSSQYYHDSHYSYNWDFGIVDTDRSINAFCLPGGTIRVTAALLETLQPTSGEIAALLGHEMGHVLARHAQKRMLSQQLLQSLASALLLDNSSSSSSNNNNRRRRRHQPKSIGQAIGETLLGATDWLGQQRFSRRDEYQADAVAWDLLTASGTYNPQSLQSLLQKLASLEDSSRQKASSSSSSSSSASIILLEQVEAWSRTHPATKDRIRALESKWHDLPRRQRQRLSRNPI